jgi:hypothetical protein
MEVDASILSSPIGRANGQPEPEPEPDHVAEPVLEPEPVALRSSSRKRQKRTGAFEF